MDPLSPRPNEIDLRFVPAAGVAGSYLKPDLRTQLHELFIAEQALFAHFGHTLKISTALDCLHAVLTLEMLLVSNYIDYRNIFQLLSMFLNLQRAMIYQVERENPDLSKAKEFGTFKWNVESIKLDRRFTMDLLVDILTTQKNASESMRSLFAQELRPRTKVKAEAEVSSDVVFEKIKLRSEEFPETLSIEGRDFKRIDLLDIMDDVSEKKHHFSIQEEGDRYRSRQKQKYPDGTVVEDVGVHFAGGHAQWEIFNVEPNRDVYVIARIDYVRGDYECEVHINGKKGPALSVPGNDMKFRWRNWPLLIPAEMVTEPVLRISLTPVKSDRDVNLFKVWVYQPM